MPLPKIYNPVSVFQCYKKIGKSYFVTAEKSKKHSSPLKRFSINLKKKKLKKRKQKTCVV